MDSHTNTRAVNMKTAILLIGLILFAGVYAHATDLPYVEDFESATPGFDFPAGSDWGVTDAHGAWDNFTGNGHLDNNNDGTDQTPGADQPGEYRAIMSQPVLIPNDAGSPTVSFWYKANLGLRYNVDDDDEEFEWRRKKDSRNTYWNKFYRWCRGKIRRHDQIYVDVHYTRLNSQNQPVEVIKTIKTFNPTDNTGDFFRWTRISLAAYKNKAIRIAFRQKISHAGAGRVFVVDNLRIDQLPKDDADKDAIPDVCDPTPNSENLPAVTEFQSTMGDALNVNLQWSPLQNEELLAGYRIYRKSATSKRPVLLNADQLIGRDESSFLDETVQNVTDYVYTIMAVSKEGREGEAADSGSISVAYNLTPFPYEESFDSIAPLFDFPEASEWGVAEDHHHWTAFSGLFHLESNLNWSADPDPEATQWDKFWKWCWGDRNKNRFGPEAIMRKRVHIPADADKPILSFWYKMDLPGWRDKIAVDVHYVKHRNYSSEREYVARDVLRFHYRDNTDAYEWISVPLKRFKGTEVWVSFRHRSWGWQDNSAGMFIVDDLRISEKPAADDNRNRIPDEYEIALNGAMLPYAKNFDATPSVTQGQVELSWTPIETRPTLPELAGHHLYRYAHDSDAPPVKVNDGLIPPDAIHYTDTTVANDHGYYYYLVGVSSDSVEGYPGLTVPAYVAFNPTTVDNVTAAWEDGKARLEWTPIDTMTYQIHRQTGGQPMALLSASDTMPFIDDTAEYVFTYDFSLASVQQYTDPFLQQSVTRIGPLSPAITLDALPAATVTVDDAISASDGRYIIRSGPNGTYLLQGTYNQLEGNVIVTARLGDLVVTGTGANGQFTVELPMPGAWEITLQEEDGWREATAEYEWIVDDTPPLLNLDGAPVRITSSQRILLSGTASDLDSPMGSVIVTSSRYSGQSFKAVLTPTGAFNCDVPLKPGDNQLTVIARDSVANSTTATVTATQLIAALPALTIDSPASGTTVPDSTVNVGGTVRSSLSPDKIRLVLGDRIVFPSGSDTPYTYTFTKIPLTPGPNTLQVRAETTHGNVTAQTFVTHAADSEPQAHLLPTIEIFAPQPDTYLTQNPVVQGLARSDLGIAAVTINGQNAALTGAGNTAVSFEHRLTQPAGQTTLPIAVTATDTKGTSHSLTYQVHFDTAAPVITLSGTPPAAPPAVNAINTVPYVIRGTMTEEHPAGLTVNNQNVPLLPGNSTGTWTFDATLTLVQNQEQPISLQAWDHAGNQTGTEWIVRLDTGIEFEVVNPRNGSDVTSDADTLNLDVTVRITGATAQDTATVSLDGGAPIPLTLNGTTATTTMAVDATTAPHRLLVTVANPAGHPLARHSSTFTVVNTATIPLKVERQEPVNAAVDVEPNDTIAFYFNKPIDPARLTVTVHETAHGPGYASTAKGTQVIALNKIETVAIHRDHEPVPGHVSQFPGNTMAAFYAERDYAYGARVFATVTYDGVEIARTRFTIRPLPTLIQGFVADQFKQSLAGIEVALPDLNRTSITNSDGGYGFGFGDKAAATIPSGRHRAVINPNLKNRTFGTLEKWITVEKGRLNNADVEYLPILNPQEPFRRLESYAAQPALLADGDLTLQLANAELIFPDGQSQGDVHVQFLPTDQLGYPSLPSVIPHWAFSIQPMGVQVNGPVGITMTMPPLYGGHDYLTDLGDYVVLLGFDPNAMQLVPVGVGQVDEAARKVSSVGDVALQRLDYFGYALVNPDQQTILKQFIDGEIGLAQMIGVLAAGQ